jgi:hypothetical protein
LYTGVTAAARRLLIGMESEPILGWRYELEVTTLSCISPGRFSLSSWPALRWSQRLRARPARPDRLDSHYDGETKREEGDR